MIKFINKNKIILLLIFIAFLLRTAYLKENLFFGYEQGRDFLKVREILAGDLTLIGPKTDYDGIFHGVFWYYLLSVMLVVFKGNPFFVQIIFVVFNCIGIFFLYKAVEKIFNSRVGLIAALLYSFSYSSIIYSRWLSNPTLSPFCAIIILFGLSKLKNNIKYILLIAVFYSLLIHLEVVAAITLLPGLIVYLLIHKIKIHYKYYVASFIVMLIMLSPYIIFNFRHDNIIFHGVATYLSNTNKLSFGKIEISQFINEIKDNVFPYFGTTALIIFASLTFIPIVKIKNLLILKNTIFLFVLLFFAPILFVILRINALRHFYIITPIPISILMSYSLYLFFNKKINASFVIIITLIIIGNLLTIIERIPRSSANFLYHSQHMYLSDQLKLVDYIYNDAKGIEFNYDYFSIPYWKNESWEYLFSWHGKKRYGYLPSKINTDIFYVLIEPDEAQPLYQKNWYNEMNRKSVLLEDYKSRYLTVEKRLRN